MASLEQSIFGAYLDNSSDEKDLKQWLNNQPIPFSLIVTQGFEERSIGVLRSAVHASNLSEVIIGKYNIHQTENSRYAAAFESIFRNCKCPCSNARCKIDVDGGWLRSALSDCKSEVIVFDITGISNRALLPCLDVLAASPKVVYLAYSEAETYWPPIEEWTALRKDLKGIQSVSDIVDSKPWLVGYEHKVEFIPGHDGYDTAGRNRTLIGFLPFKFARIASILSEESYANFTFIAGKPRLSGNVWRLDALKEINHHAIKSWPLVEMNTFGYRKAVEGISKLLFFREPGGQCLLEHGDVHVAILGSKLQTVACWVSSCLLPCLSMVTSVPTRYYAEAFSNGVGNQWIFPLTRPAESKRASLAKALQFD